MRPVAAGLAALLLGSTGAQAESKALCRMIAGDETKAKGQLELVGRVGALSFYSERGGLLCSEPAGLSGDCQIVRGKTVIVSRNGNRDVRIEALTPAPYLLYGQDYLRCSEPPPAP